MSDRLTEWFDGTDEDRKVISEQYDRGAQLTVAMTDFVVHTDGLMNSAHYAGVRENLKSSLTQLKEEIDHWLQKLEE